MFNYGPVCTGTVGAWNLFQVKCKVTTFCGPNIIKICSSAFLKWNSASFSKIPHSFKNGIPRECGECKRLFWTRRNGFLVRMKEAEASCASIRNACRLFHMDYSVKFEQAGIFRNKFDPSQRLLESWHWVETRRVMVTGAFFSFNTVFI